MALVEEMKRKEIPPNNATYGTFIKWLAKEKKMDDAIKLLKQMEMNRTDSSPTFHAYCSIVSEYCKERNTEEALKWMHVMREMGINVDDATLTIVLRLLCEGGKVYDARSLLCNAIGSGYIADAVSYGTIIEGYFRSKEPKKALKVWDEMREHKVIPNVKFGHYVVRGLCLIGRLDDAIDKLSELTECGILHDENTYGTIIIGCLRKGEIEKALRYYKEMVESSLRPTVEVNDALIKELCESNMTEEAVSLLEAVKEVDLSAVTYGRVICAVCRDGRTKEALHLIERMIRKGLIRYDYAHRCIIEAFTKQGRTERGNELGAKINEIVKK